MVIAVWEVMNFICQHCGELRAGRAYRVMSEEEGVILLDMIVCDSCYLQAKNLGLETQEINLRDRRGVGPSASRHIHNS
jgi:hypothetical protein